MGECLVSVIVPVYNAEKYLDKCIKSVINQTFTKIEIILVNDGSTDASINICNSYSNDPRVKIINKKNEGLSAARQSGIDIAAGTFFCTIDADDYMEEHYIETLYSKIVEESADICVCATVHHRGDNSKIFGFNPHLSTKQMTKSDIENEYSQLLQTYYMSDSWNKLYRKEFVTKSGVKFCLPKEYKGNDLLFNHLLMLHLPKIAVVNEALYHYFVLEGTLSRRKNERLQQGFMFILDKLVKEVEQLDYSLKLGKELGKLYVMYMYLVVLEHYKYESVSKKRKDAIRNFQLVNDAFLKANKMILIEIRKLHHISLKIVAFFLKTKSTHLFLFFLRARQLGKGE
ncbi:glycosyltransferase involved in cell wall biosynthesis [Paenibacillus phyllosphaerae]|uniref:Glycosyltransferase involved in cell wall biosynthesis n=1 Tax=Paenibacillus phyllosphaerae TaxID=274593 RepID=A0A7W5AXJ8_9BACL|nr:glycosyltransferase family 2 protein [Paenibacillus phyllosphaerae]MBB3110557.1 glycosyltransferase involved in cell wall biosynthesis [Paenibacillus phyllosphaerae]